MRQESPQSHIIFCSHAVATSIADGIWVCRYLCPVWMWPIHQVLEEGINMHRMHPSLNKLLVTQAQLKMLDAPFSIRYPPLDSN